MSKFVSNELKTIEFDDGEWVKIPKEISVEDSEKIADATKQVDGISVALCFIREWNFKMPDGTVPPVTVENIKKLDVMVFNRITEELWSLISPLKKKYQKLEELPKEEEPTLSTPTT